MNTIGVVRWTRDDLKSKLEEFSELYKNRPIEDNYGGMGSPHMFSVWFVLQLLKPKYIIESGVWKGQGTWFFEKASPDSQIHSIDINLRSREYISRRVTYHEKDFFRVSWEGISKEDALCFFDDHQNAVERVRFAEKRSFRTLMFEDNYPLGQGDCYTLKQAFARGGKDADYLRSVLRVYYEFPPVFKMKKTRWGARWSDEVYPTPEPLCTNVEAPYLQVYYTEAMQYTWICYVELI